MAQPNILLITTDQQRFDTIAAAGNPAILTPHLDWLWHQGIAFRRAYTDCPLCIPARATIMTGQFGHTHGQLTNGGKSPMGDRPTLPGILTRSGYQTRAVGKMHFVPLRANYGFEHMELLPDYYRHMARHYPGQRPKDHGVGENEMQPVFATVPESLSLTHWTVDRSIDFLETRDESRPFFLWTSFAKPHPPFDCQRDYWAIYEGISMPDAVFGDWSARPEQVPPGWMQPTWQLNNVHRYTREQVAASRRAYYACISQIDYNLGVLFARMREMGLFRNTWILFTADHGEMLGDHYMGAKSTFFEGSAHVPLMIRPPGEWDTDLRRGTTCDALACLADILPTCLAAAGVEAPAGCRPDGLDLLELASGRAHRDVLIGAGSDDAYHMVHDGRFKWHFTTRGGAELLFDLASDPMERQDLARSEQAREELDRLGALLYESLARRGHPAARDGALHSLGAPQTEHEVRAQQVWPGFHSMKVDTDVLH